MVAGWRPALRPCGDRDPRLGQDRERGSDPARVALAVRCEGGARRSDRPRARGLVTLLLGTVLERDGAVYRVSTSEGEVRAVLRGKAKRDTAGVVVGDRVLLE